MFVTLSNVCAEAPTYNVIRGGPLGDNQEF